MKIGAPATQYPVLSLPALGLFNLLFLVWWLEVGLRVPALGAIRLEFILAAVVSAIAVYKYTSGPRVSARRLTKTADNNSDISRCVAIYLVVLLLSLPLSLNLAFSWDVFINRVAKLALLGVLISQFVVSPATLRVYFFTLLLAFLKVGQEGFLGKITGNMVWENQGVPRLHGTAGSMFGDPNSLSGKTVSTIPFIWFLFPGIRSRYAKLLVVVMLIFALNIIIFTASRTGYLTLLMIGILIVWFSQGKRAKLFLFLIVAGIAAVSFVPPEYKERFLSSFTGQEAEGQSSATRKALLFDSLTAFSENPLGLGLGNFSRYQAMHGRNAQETHNLYTQLLAEAGIQGFLCFVALIIVILRKLFRVRNAMAAVIRSLQTHLANAPPNDARSVYEEELRDSRLILLATTAVIVFVLVRLVLGVFGHDMMEIYWWFAAGMAMALNNIRQVAEKRCSELTASTSDDSVPARSHRAPSRPTSRVPHAARPYGHR